ncbi:class I SAM-dependent methyltransferase [Enterococcus faecium]|uniref:class I SAM-dependent methyltransferase n=1 Tax=Enterococcus faecium TaxID=1352 RepID=UPI00372D3729
MTKNIFDSIANHYDSPDRQALSKIIREELTTYLPRDSHQKVLLDYGGGTGLVSLPLAERFKELIIADASETMLKMAEEKIQAADLKNVRTIHADASVEFPAVQANLILLSLVLLHIPDTENILTKLYEILAPGGQLIIVDFDKNEQISHPKVHNGFSQEELNNRLEKTGFVSATSHTFHRGEKLFMNKNASLFLSISQKA